MTMKSLDQIEPRIDVAKLSGDSSNLYIISKPGSYYLSGNITGVAGKHGISVQADNVTLDLHGFALIGPGSTNFVGIYANQQNITVRNGTITGWAAGITATVALVEKLVLSSNSIVGITIGSGIIKDCISSNNTGDGIDASGNCEISHCVAIRNSQNGIFAGDESTVEYCVVSLNGGTGIRQAARVVKWPFAMRANPVAQELMSLIVARLSIASRTPTLSGSTLAAIV